MPSHSKEHSQDATPSTTDELVLEPVQAQEHTQNDNDTTPTTSNDTTTPPITNYVEYKEQLLDKTAKYEQVAEEEDAHFSMSIRSEESKELFEVPLRTGIRVKGSSGAVSLERTSVWALLALGQLTEKELDDFEKNYYENLSMNERISLNLLKGASKGNLEDKKIFWNISERVATRPKTIAQINLNMGENKGEEKSIMTKMLDEITKNIANAQEANVVPPRDSEEEPTP